MTTPKPRTSYNDHTHPDHTHHWVPRPVVSGVLTCECGSTYRHGEVQLPAERPTSGK